MTEELKAVPPHYVVGCVCPNCGSTRTLLNERDGLAAKLAKVREFMEKKLDPKFWVAKELTAILQGDSK